MLVEARAECKDCKECFKGSIEIEEDYGTFLLVRGELNELCSQHHDKLRPLDDPDAYQHNVFFIKTKQNEGKMIVTSKCAIGRFELQNLGEQ